MEPLETTHEVVTVSASVFNIVTILVQVFNLLLILGLLYLFILLIKALRKYLKSGKTRKEIPSVQRPLSEILKEYRTQCHMTQEFVAERLAVSRQAVSKWENGTSVPSTSNLLALAKLYDIDPEILLKQTT